MVTRRDCGAYQVTRAPWPNTFPPVFVHAPWDEKSYYGALPKHPDYDAAKSMRDAAAAARVIEDLVKDEVIDRIVDAMGSSPPIIVAPATRPETCDNALAITYAQWLGNELGLHVEEYVFQEPGPSRFGRDGWGRLANPRTFYGRIVPNRNYLIADDVLTMGGTLADLRGFIESQGSKVICCTALAHRSGGHVPISLDKGTIYALNRRYGEALTALWAQEFNYAIECLTEPEAQFLLRFDGDIEGIRARLHGARDAGDSCSG